MRTLVLASNSHRSRSTPGWEAPRPPPGVMEMRPAACQRKRHLDRRWQRHFDFRLPQSRDAPRRDRGEIGRSDHARLGSPTGKTDDVIEPGHPPEGPQPEASRRSRVDPHDIHHLPCLDLSALPLRLDARLRRSVASSALLNWRKGARVRSRAAGVRIRRDNSPSSGASSRKWPSRTCLLPAPAPTFRQFRHHRQTDPATP